MRLKENIQIASFDLDDTLLVHGLLSDYNKQALIKLHKAGCKIVINTGRGLRFVPSQLKADYVDYIIASNGAVIYDVALKKRIQVNYIDPNDVSFIYSLVKKQHAVKLMMDNSTMVSKDMYPFYIYEHLTGKATYKSTTKDLYRFLRNFKICWNQQKLVDSKPDILKMEWTCNSKTNPEQLVELINSKCNVNAVVVKYRIIELASKKAGKGNALIDLAQFLNISKDTIAAFGDSGNDIDALLVAKYAIAVENASKEIKDIATEIIPCADQDGVGQYINSIINE